MKKQQEKYIKENKNRLNLLPLHKLFWLVSSASSFRLLLSLYGGSLLAWFIGFMARKKNFDNGRDPLRMGGIWFSFSLFTVVIGIIIWLLIL